MPKAFLVIIRGTDPKKIDEDEVPKVLGAWGNKSGTVVRQGFINGVDIVDIRLDVDRIAEFNREYNRISKNNQQDREYGDGKRQEKLPTMRPLADIFEGIDIKKYLPTKSPQFSDLETGKLTPYAV